MASLEREKLKIDKETASAIADGDYDDNIYHIISDKIVSKSRWTYRNELIIKTVQDGRFWKSHYSRGATESQEQSPYDYEEPIFIEVFPKEVTVTIYE